jgi:predicted O-methyltransferase YrrM
MDLSFTRIKASLVRRLLEPPAEARHREYSMILSADDDPGRPSRRLLDLAAKGIGAAAEIDLKEVSGRMTEALRYPDIWPGEHYRLLAALVKLERPELIVEIGTAQGLSALAMKKFLPPTGRLATFDIVPWREIKGTYLKESDLADGRLAPVIGDLSDAKELDKHRALLEQADLIFADAPKDGRFEPRFLELLETVRFKKPMLLVLDDIRVWNMLATWRSITRPKLDLTSFGHWSGTGLVDWTAKS